MTAILKQVVLSMEEVKRDILSWDVETVLKPQKPGKGFTKVPTYFESLEQYSKIFWRLLLEEFRAHLQQVNNDSSPFCTSPSVHVASPSKQGV